MISSHIPDKNLLILGFRGLRQVYLKELQCKPPADLALAPSVPLFPFRFPAWPLGSLGFTSEKEAARATVEEAGEPPCKAHSSAG